MAAHKMLIGFAVLALGVGVLASVANAAPPCGYTACSDEIAASGLSGKARRACLRQVTSECREGLCSCTGGSPRCSCVCGDGLCGPAEDCSTCPADCGPCPPTTITTTTTTSTTTAPTSSTSTTMPPPCTADRECDACRNTTDCGGSGTCFVANGTTCEHRGDGNVCVSRLGIICEPIFCTSDADCGPTMVCIVDRGGAGGAPMCCPPCP